jgi:hypothetical protein
LAFSRILQDIFWKCGELAASVVGAIDARKKKGMQMAKFTVTMKKDALTYVTAPVSVVLHITQMRVKGGGLVDRAIGRSDWFTDADAVAYAKAQSLCHPEPNRFTAYNPDGVYLASFQCGQRLAAFSVVA